MKEFEATERDRQTDSVAEKYRIRLRLQISDSIVQHLKLINYPSGLDAR